MRILSLLFAIYIFVTAATPFAHAQSDEEKKNELEKKISEYQQKLTEVRTQKNTLSSQIQYMDTQVYLTNLKTQETERRITRTTREIEILSSKIDGLDASLNTLSAQLLKRVVEGYKKKSATVFDIVLDSHNANVLMNKMKYYKTAQANNQKILVQVQETKMNFEEQKKLREKKVVELDTLKVELTAQKSDLERQQAAKRQFLEVTKNDETTYTRLIEEARRQIESFKRFVASTGANVIAPDSLGTGEGGWYYSQRDARWASHAMGDSSESVLDVGCFISSIAMVLESYGNNITPLDLASNPRYFSGGSGSACFPTSWPTAYACVPSTFNGSWPGGVRYKNISRADIDGYLNAGKPVITGVNGGSHYIVLKKIDNGAYIMNDPIWGPDKKVSDYYSISGPMGVFE